MITPCTYGRYGMGCHPPPDNPDYNMSTCHGPHIGVERWIGRSTMAAAAEQPLQAQWVGAPATARGYCRQLTGNTPAQARPFREQYDDRPDTQAAQLVTGGCLFRGYHIWLPDGGTVKGGMLGIPQYRFSGLFAPANAEFSTPIFAMPAKPHSLWLNVDAKWRGGGNNGAPTSCDSGCAGYVMVALLDAGTGAHLIFSTFAQSSINRPPCPGDDCSGQALHRLFARCVLVALRF